MAQIVGLCGIDGSGKTTVARLVTQELRNQGIRARYHHELDFAFGQLIVKLTALLMGGRRSDDMKDRLLVSKDQNRPIISALYHLLVWFDSLLAFVWFKLTPGIVVHDRWPYDFILQFKHRGYENRFIWNLFARFPRPDTLLLLKVPADVAFERKRTDPGHLNDGPEFFEHLADWMEEIAERYSYDATLDATATPEVVVREILDVIRDRSTSSK